ncbi:MAG: gliding motility-associated C-terminal domain-containing protein [Saprospiraceae bacterium]|nr:gliding motility-associated C-terminal domain-containing protein [Saprospiraceae bacterium]
MVHSTYNRRRLFLLFFLLPCLVCAQESRFDTGDDGWRAIGDPVSAIPTWFANGGNPGGWLRSVDASTGGTWQWSAPTKFLGNKCTAYGNFLRFDLTASDFNTGNNQPDVTLVAGPVRLVFNTPVNPATTWTHYDILLSETAGWRLGNLNGQVPTAAQFRSALSNLTGLQIRGEFLSSADDTGGLDNVVLESNFGFDLDANDSTTPLDAVDFVADSLCSGDSPVADLDVLLLAQTRVDSIVVEIQNPLDGPAEVLNLPAAPATVAVTGNNTPRIVLRNNGTASASDFQTALLLIRYRNVAQAPSRALRLVRSQVFTFCGETAAATTSIPYFPAGYAGADSTLNWCSYSPAQDLRTLLGTPVTQDGRWSPVLPAGQVFRPATDNAGTYTYIVESPAGCPSDSAQLQISLEYPPTLPADTLICRDSTLSISVQPAAAFSSWAWSTGQNQPSIVVAASGTYAVTVSSTLGSCIFQDSVRVGQFVARAGADAQVVLCAYDDPVDLRDYLGPNLSAEGRWAPPLASGADVFRPAADSPGQFQHLVDGQFGCPGDTALVQVQVAYPPVLQADTIICRDSALTLRVLPPGLFTDWQWSTGSGQPLLVVREAGTYGVRVRSVLGDCVFADSVRVGLITCSECPLYVPNAFSPDDDGRNDLFETNSSCVYLYYRLMVFDRWGNQIFMSEDPQVGWDGRYRGKELPPAVFVWVLELESELLGAPQRRRFSGNVTLFR